MSKKISKKNEDKSSIGFFYGGVLKGGCVCFFSVSNEAELQTCYQSHRKYFGRYVTCKSALCDSGSDSLFKQLKEAFSESHSYEDLYTAAVTSVVDKLKKLTGTTKIRTLKERVEKDHDDTENDGTDNEIKKSTKKGGHKNDGSDDETDKPKKSTKKGGHKDDGSNDEADKPKKSTKNKKDHDESEKTKKSSKNKKGHKDEDEDDDEMPAAGVEEDDEDKSDKEDEDEEEDEKPSKKKSSKSEKSEKSKKK